MTGYPHDYDGDENDEWLAVHMAGFSEGYAAALDKIAREVVGVSAADVHDEEQLRFGAIRRALTEGADQ